MTGKLQSRIIECNKCITLLSQLEKQLVELRPDAIYGIRRSIHLLAIRRGNLRFQLKEFREQSKGAICPDASKTR